MISKEEAIKISRSHVVTQPEMVSVIQRYIFDKKGVKVDINSPRDPLRVELMIIGFETASNYYLLN